MIGSERETERTIRIAGRRYKLATPAVLAEMPYGQTHAYRNKSISRQNVQPEQAFEVPLTSFHDGYGYTFANSDLKTYERADGWDATVAGRVTSWDRAVTLEPFDSAPTRGYIVDFGGYVYVMRGEWAKKYRPTTGSAQWMIVGQHYFGATSRVAGPPAVHEGHLYVPLQDLTPDVINRWHRLSTVANNTVETQALTQTGSPTGGTFTLNFNDGLTSTTTAALAWNITAADMQTALQAIPGLGKVTVVRTGTTTNFVWTITMTAAPTALATSSPPALVRVSSLSGGSSPTVTVTTPTAGVGDQWDRGPAGAEAMRFIFFEKKLTRAVYPNGVSSASADPLTLGSWGTTYTVLDQTQPITSLLVFERFLVPIKTDTVATFDEAATAIPEALGVEGVIDSQSGMGAVVAHAHAFINHRTGLIRWRPGGPFAYVGAEQDGQLDGDRTPGHGRVQALAPFGKTLYFGMNDAQTGDGIIGSLTPGNGNRGPYTPHMHHFLNVPVEDVKIVSFQAEAITSHFPNTVVNDATVGTIDWTGLANLSADDNAFATATGATAITKYAKATGFNFSIPLTATIQGIFAIVRRKALGAQTTTTLAYTGATQNFVVPAGVTALHVDAQGAAGGAGAGAAGGRGGRVQSDIPVTPGETLVVDVGGVGAAASAGSAGGHNGGGAGGVNSSGEDGAGGGGRTDIKRSATLLLAAAGGGGGTYTNGGDGGGTSGGSPAGGGGGGTASAGGVGGPNFGTGSTPGVAGASGTGGPGAAITGTFSGGGGGGGGGYYGGGGGGSAGGSSPVVLHGGAGGGGSSYSSGSNTVHTSGYRAGSGQVVLTYDSAQHVDDASVKVIKGGTISGAERGFATNWAATETAFGYGSPVDLHGLAWLPPDINDTGFGLAFAASLSAAALIASIDSIEMQVYYTLPGGSEPTPFLAALTTSNAGQTCQGWVYNLPRYGQSIANDPNVNRAVAGKDLWLSRYAQPGLSVRKQWHTVEGWLDLYPEVNTPGVQLWASIDDLPEFRLTLADGSPAVYKSGFTEYFLPPDQRAGGSHIQLHVKVPALQAGQVPVRVTLREFYLRGVYLPLRAEVVHCVVMLDESEELDDLNTSRATAQEMKAELVALAEPGAPPTTFQDIDGSDWYAHIPNPEFLEYGVAAGRDLTETVKWAAILDIRKLPGLLV